MDDESSKLVDCGIALLKKSNSKKYVVVNEPLAIETVNNVLALKYNRPTDALIKKLFAELEKSIFAADFDKSNTSKGIAWQYLVLGKLMDFNDKTVFDFVNGIYSNSPRLPDWTKSAIINIKSYGNLKILSWIDNTLENVKDDVDVIQKFLQGLIQNYVLVPSQKMRPDGIYISKLNMSKYWTLLISAKVYTENLSGEKVEMDKRSTNWDLTYYQKDGTKLKEKFNNVCRNYEHCGSLRIHFIFPGVASSYISNRGGCHVEGNDVIMYIDKTLLNRYFPEDYVNYLKKILS